MITKSTLSKTVAFLFIPRAKLTPYFNELCRVNKATSLSPGRNSLNGRSMKFEFQ